MLNHKFLVSASALGSAAALASSIVIGAAYGGSQLKINNIATTTQAASPEAFLAEIDAAMKKMITAMDIKPSGDVDHDFVAMMIPHHHGAIDIAKAELLYGRNEHLRRIAQEIIVEQQEEIAAMRLALGEPLPPSSGSPLDP
jgi:uncharacterized protein (DUF305 family)